MIPAEARAELGIQPGEKLIVMRHPVNKGLMIFKFDAMREFLDEMEKAFQAVAAQESLK